MRVFFVDDGEGLEGLRRGERVSIVVRISGERFVRIGWIVVEMVVGVEYWG